MAAGVSSCIQFVSFELQLVRRQKIYLGPREGRRDREDWRRRLSPPFSFSSPLESFFLPPWSEVTKQPEKKRKEKKIVFFDSRFLKNNWNEIALIFFSVSTTYRQFFAPLKMVSACFPILCCNRRAAVVAQRKSTRIVTERSWVQIQPGAGLFSLIYPHSSVSLIQVPWGGETLLIFL